MTNWPEWAEIPKALAILPEASENVGGPAGFALGQSKLRATSSNFQPDFPAECTHGHLKYISVKLTLQDSYSYRNLKSQDIPRTKYGKKSLKLMANHRSCNGFADVWNGGLPTPHNLCSTKFKDFPGQISFYSFFQNYPVLKGSPYKIFGQTNLSTEILTRTDSNFSNT